jgi:hypothetical protein
LRKQAKSQGYIQSFELLEVSEKAALPFHLMLVTTYQSQAQFDVREEHFKILIDAAGKPKLKNTILPKDFRKVVFSPNTINHWH